MLSLLKMKMWKWRGQVWWHILRICALPLTHPSAHSHTVNTHTHREHTHTPWTHTHTHPEQWAVNACPGSSWGFGVLLKGSSVVVLKVEREHCTFTPHTNNPCRTWDSNPRPSCYKSDSLSLGHDYPLGECREYSLQNFLWNFNLNMKIVHLSK